MNLLYNFTLLLNCTFYTNKPSIKNNKFRAVVRNSIVKIKTNQMFKFLKHPIISICSITNETYKTRNYLIRTSKERLQKLLSFGTKNMHVIRENEQRAQYDFFF